ncbi:hypothetical protein KC678_02030 [Candidatus Dojkabacteria bacterium]|uniref:Uncharacterized protein n=1 Tax=Candidatus Dojkabacteria bacterium TaxID=2099670 RepID=A0A955L1A4_9BACT|nr:hypothetical protein [Candidatus Dojkabacteria bacterium]
MSDEEPKVDPVISEAEELYKEATKDYPNGKDFPNSEEAVKDLVGNMTIKKSYVDYGMYTQEKYNKMIDHIVGIIDRGIENKKPLSWDDIDISQPVKTGLQSSKF